MKLKIEIVAAPRFDKKNSSCSINQKKTRNQRSPKVETQSAP